MSALCSSAASSPNFSAYDVAILSDTAATLLSLVSLSASCSACFTSSLKFASIYSYTSWSTANDLYYLTVDGKKVDNKTVYYENNIYAAKSGKKWGFVDARNNAIVPYQYDEVTELDEYGFAGINKNGKHRP